MLRLVHAASSGTVLLTWTHRTFAVQDDGYGTGVRASLSYDDARSFNLTSDYIILAGQNDDWAPCKYGSGCGGAWGNTVELEDGSLITVYALAVGPVVPDNPGLQRVGMLHWRLP